MKELKKYSVSQEELQKMSYAAIVTSKGVMFFKLFFKDAPNTVANFAHLASSGFYNGLNFHRVIENFVAQGGCPVGNGTGGPNWAIACEAENNPNKHIKGTLSMAHAGRDTGGSQFFICFSPQPHLDREHTIFGQIEKEDKKSFEVLDSIRQQDEIVKIVVADSIKTLQKELNIANKDNKDNKATKPKEKGEQKSKTSSNKNKKKRNDEK